MNNHEFVAKIKNVADNYKTVYMMGVFGSPVNDYIIDRKKKESSWYTASKVNSLQKYKDKGYFGFDCVNLIKGVLWGWSGDKNHIYGGAKYKANGVPDTNANGMIQMCKNVSTNFSSIEIGEAVWLTGHIGVYIGDGKVIECTPKWTNGVQYTACLNIGAISGMNGRKWTKRGKLPWLDYVKEGGSSMSYLDSTQTLYKGVKNDYVKQLQLDLIKLGYNLSPYGADGSFGSLTDTIVRKFQTDNRLEVDGRFGGASKKKMRELLEQKSDNNEVKELKDKINKLEADLKAANSKLATTENTLKTVQKQLVTAQNQVKGAEAKNGKYKEYFNLQNELSK